jgi:hypothetical protein
MRHSSAYSLAKWVLLLFGPTLIVALGIWLLFPSPIEIRIVPVSTTLRRYDDGAGHHPLVAEMRFTNVSNRTVWYLGGLPGAPDVTYQELVDGRWDFHMSSISDNGRSSPKVWTALDGGESITVQAGPVSEAANEMRVGLAFTSQLFAPSKVHWIFSPIAKLVKRGEVYFWEPIASASQEEQVLGLPP